MKEFEFTFDEGLNKGLRRFSNNPRNSQSLVECHNLAPSEQGLALHEAVISLNATGVSWGGLGKWTDTSDLRDITLRISDYVSDVDLKDVSVYIDGVLKGTTDDDGELDIDDVETGGHVLLLTREDYITSSSDCLLNDYILVS